MQTDLSFFIAMDGAPYPVRFDPTVLDEFERDHADNMDLELRKFSDAWFGPTFFLERENRLGVIAQLIRDAMRDEDGVLVAKYVLWMVARYPEISGIRIHEDTYEFMADAFDDFDCTSQSIH
ncbi:hypothetical protein RYZ26_10895 [Terasakiella sp. A23]|uniref:hypothetical protein n=1 Tax=Terasakiella sp. FCG-A23 TaxID=3080561 RepID=UPI002954B7F4|nr:hypothetical protein [Terasakiella sp. A23]MDV7340102.1 hypothetical protein [Terasakiella sp. A23]